MSCRSLLALFISLCASCDLPRDASGTLDRVRGGTIRVGFVVDTPWVTDSSDGAGGVEAALVNEVARSVGARVAWIRAPQSNLLETLHARELDLVIAGLTSTSPYKQQVA